MTIVDPGTDETGGAAPRPLAVIVAMCAAHIASMTGFAAFPSLLPALQPLWALSNTEAGWINGIFFAGYVSAVPVMVSMTDRVDARSIYLLGLAISAAGLAGFALAAHGFWSALLWHAVAGIGVGSTYMTGLKVMTDRLAKPAPSRAVAVYAAMFSTGAALSFALNGAIGGRFGWQAAFAVSAAGPVLAFVLALAMLRPRPPAAAERPQTALLDFRPVLKNRTALGYMLGYAGHSWELFALRGWLVAFLVYAGIGGPAGEGSGAGEAAAIAAAASLAGVPSTILGNELAQRFGRRRVILSMMTASLLISCLVGFAAGLPAGLLIALVFAYSVAIMGDSGSLTAGTAGAADAGYGGATLALHSILGFGGAFFGPLAVGLVLDAAGGETSDLGWGLAFIAMGLGSAMGAAGLVWAQRSRRSTA
jgi:MFS family permease